MLDGLQSSGSFNESKNPDVNHLLDDTFVYHDLVGYILYGIHPILMEFIVLSYHSWLPNAIIFSIFLFGSPFKDEFST
jgi:hypothetical protein